MFQNQGFAYFHIVPCVLNTSLQQVAYKQIPIRNALNIYRILKRDTSLRTETLKTTHLYD